MGWLTPHSMRIGPYPFDSGAASGSKTIILTYDALDLSWKHHLLGRLTVTEANTDAGDTLDAALQVTRDGVLWDTIGAWGQVIGTTSPTPTAPEVQEIQIQQHIPLDTAEEAYEPTGSAGAAALPAGTVRNSLFPGKIYVGGRWIASFRVLLTVVDADVDGRFTGVVDLWLS